MRRGGIHRGAQFDDDMFASLAEKLAFNATPVDVETERARQAEDDREHAEYYRNTYSLAGTRSFR